MNSLSFVKSAVLRKNPRGKFSNHDQKKITGTKERSPPGWQNATTRELLTQFQELCIDMGIVVSNRELNELGLFCSFISTHVRDNPRCAIPCMFLWAEWARFHLKQTNTCPDLILENEFRNLVADQFGLDITRDEVRGSVFQGIQFVSKRYTAMDASGRSVARA